MSFTSNGDDPLSSAKRLEQIDRIVNSRVLQNSEALCNLLKFLGRQSIEAPEVPLKEHQIAAEVFSRPNFDPRVDSTVRVQMSRLRGKLTEYYSDMGRNEPILVEIPKGSHIVTFRQRAVAPPLLPVPITPPTPVHEQPGEWKWATAGLLLVVAVLGLLLSSRSGQRPPAVSQTSNPLLVFWRDFLQSSAEPLVIFSNAEFVGRPETGLRYYRPGQDMAESVFDHYTGVGEVISVHELDQVFARLGDRKSVV